MSEDQLAALAADSARFGTTGGAPAEREQAITITIDVAWRHFATARRRFIVADAPGHEQYTRNMATGASTADLAVLLVDARQGLHTQARRHSHIVALFGIREIVVVVDKMDTVGWSEREFERIRGEYLGFAANLGAARIVCIPVCALSGDNVTPASRAMAWYRGPTLIAHLESVEIASGSADLPFRMPVQWVNRPNAEFRGYAGTIVAGKVRPGDRLAVMPSGRSAQVARIVAFERDLDEAQAGQAVTLTLAEEVDVGRGDVLAAHDARPAVADQFCAHVLWMSEQPMLPERSYLMQIGTAALPAQVTELKHRINVDTFEHVAAMGARSVRTVTQTLQTPAALLLRCIRRAIWFTQGTMMKKLLLAGISFAALVAAPATAADLGGPAYRAPVVYAPVASWTGFYVGGDIGGAWQNSQTFLFSDPGNAAFASCTQCTLAYQPELLTAGGKSGLLGGFHIGYDYQGGAAFVLGAEWDFMWASKLNQSASGPLFSDASSTFAIVPVVNSSLSFAEQTKWLTSLRGRAGYLVTPGLLVYGTGGVAWGKFEQSAFASCVVPDPNGCSTSGGISSFSQRETKFGVVLGAGLEYQIPTTRFRARLEYLYYGFDPHETTGVGPWIATSGGGPLPCVNTPTCAANYNFGSSGNTNIQTLRVGISYAFGGYAAAPAFYK